jgi:muramoyltetrapeptide carboxypeptidase
MRVWAGHALNSEKRSKPYRLSKGDTIGIFTPSTPANVLFREKYLHGIREIERLGFHVLEGSLTGRCTADGYRSGDPRERAEEFMDLIVNPLVNGLISSMGGMNTGSLLPYLDFSEIRNSRKVICGYSDVTALHMAIYPSVKKSSYWRLLGMRSIQLSWDLIAVIPFRCLRSDKVPSFRFQLARIT